jgi:hypothetical protein
MAAAEVYLDNDEEELPDVSASHPDYIWQPEEDPEEPDLLIREEAIAKLPKLPRVKPSVFTQTAFLMPTEVGEGDQQTIELRNFSFKERPHLRRIYDTACRRVLLMCARQVEKSTLLGNISIAYSCIVPGYRTLYVSPSATQTKTFSADRIKEPLETSTFLRQFTTKMLSMNILEKQFINRSKITLRYAFLNADRCRGIPAWALFLDEIQDILADNIPVIEACQNHAPKRWRRNIYSGTPKSLDNTIETYWSSMSTMNEWVVPCEGCNNWNILGEKNIGRKGIVCTKCGKYLNAQHPRAQWAAQRQFDDVKVPFEGYRISQLMVPWVDWNEILIAYEKHGRDKFYNETLGISYDSGMRPLTRAQVMAVCNPEITMYDSKQREYYKQLSAAQPIFAGIDWGCHDEDTRILTRDGFKYFRDLGDKDEVAQWDPDTREMTYTKPKAVTVRDWDQPLLHFKTKGGLDMMLTHTHRMRVGAQQGEHWLTESAGELAERGGNVKFVGHVEWKGDFDAVGFILPGLPKSPGYKGSEDVEYRMDDWLEFLGYVLSEGGVCLKKNKVGELVPYCVKMSQRETVSPEKYEKIRMCMVRMGLNFTAFPNPKTGDVNWTIYGKQLWSWLAKHVGMTGDVKRIPAMFKRLSKRQLRILFDAMLLGDGYVDPRDGCTGGAYYSTSKKLCEDFQELCIKLGLRCVVRLHKPAAGNRKARYRASWSVGRDYTFNKPSTSIERVPYKGKVYCCSVPTGYIVTERNGCIAYQGNTGEHSYTVLTLATYIGRKFRCFYIHRFVGEETEPDRQIELIIETLRYYNVALIGCDYGGGHYPNDKLVRVFGPNKVWKYQYSNTPKQAYKWNPQLLRFMLHRTEVMSQIFNAIKRRRECEFPRWEEFEKPYAQDFLNIYSEDNKMTRIIQYKHALDKPDDSFHSFLYCWLVSMLKFRRPDIIKPNREDAKGNQVPIYTGPVEQS